MPANNPARSARSRRISRASAPARRGGIQRQRQHHDFAGIEHRAHARANAGEFGGGGFEQPVDVGLGDDQRRDVAVHELREARFAIAARQHERDAWRASWAAPTAGSPKDWCAGARTTTTRAVRCDRGPPTSRASPAARRACRRAAAWRRCASAGCVAERQVLPQVHGDVDGVGAQRHAEVAGETAAPQELGQAACRARDRPGK